MNVIDSFKLNGRTAIVTGGAGRYGRQIVEALGEAGATVYIASRNMENLEKTATQFRAAGLDVRPLPLDQGDEKSCDELIRRVVEETGRLDILVNNSVSRCACSDWKKELSVYDASFHINASGMFYLTAVAGEVMKKQKSGSIINIGSFMGLVGPEFANYAGTDMNRSPSPAYFYEKGGLVNFTRWTASVLGEYNVRVNAIHPGGLQEDVHPEAFVRQYSERTQLKRMANQEDLKGIIVFLASDASSYLTGTNIPVDGGYTAK